MRVAPKPADRLTARDFMRHPVWTYIPETRTRDETWMKPVRRLPVDDLDNKIVGATVTLANGQKVWAIIGNIDVSSARATEHFIGLSLRIKRSWFHLARYHDVDHERHGPHALARRLGLPVTKVFPITYDVTPYARGDADALRGQVRQHPRRRLSESALTRLALA